MISSLSSSVSGFLAIFSANKLDILPHLSQTQFRDLIKTGYIISLMLTYFKLKVANFFARFSRSSGVYSRDPNDPLPLDGIKAISANSAVLMDHDGCHVSG